MKLLVHNDGKKKNESWEVWTEELKNYIERGYGANFDEALDDYKTNIATLLTNIVCISNSIIGESYEAQACNWKGEPLKEGTIEKWMKENKDHEMWKGHRYI